jgi:hypothetical protein
MNRRVPIRKDVATWRERDNIRFNHEVHACPKTPDAGSVSSMELCPKEVSLTSHSQQVLGVLVLKGNFR